MQQHQECTTGSRLRDIVCEEPDRSYYYSGQGKIFLAKRDASGQPSEFHFLGNNPRFTLSNDGRIEIMCEAWQTASWPLLFGGDCQAVTAGEFASLDMWDVKARPDAPAVRFMIRPGGSQHEYYLVFEGVNTANWQTRVHLELYRVTFEMSSEIELINPEIAGFPLYGRYYKDETRAAMAEYGPYGRVYVWDDRTPKQQAGHDSHIESRTGMRWPPQA